MGPVVVLTPLQQKKPASWASWLSLCQPIFLELTVDQRDQNETSEWSNWVPVYVSLSTMILSNQEARVIVSFEHSRLV